MAKYILLTSCQVGNQLFRYGELLDEQVQSPIRLLAAGAQIAWIPNPDVEAWASRIRALRVRGSSDDQDAGFPLLGPIKQPFGATIDVDWNKGDDRSSGYPGSPIKSNAELASRLGANPVDRNVLTTHRSYAPLGADPLRLDFTVVQNDTSLRNIMFQGPPLSVKKAGTIGAVTNRVRSTGTPWQITGTAFDASDVGLRLLIPTGVRAGVQSAVAVNVSGTQARTSGWMLADYTSLFNTPITPQVGDPYQVLQSSGQLEVDYVRVRGQALANTAIPFDMVQFKDYDFTVAVAGSATRFAQFHREGVNVSYANCRFLAVAPTFSRFFIFTGRPFDVAAYSAFGYQQCCVFVSSALWRSMPANGDFVDGCLALGEIACDFGAQLVVTGETLIQAGGSVEARLFAHEDGSLLTIEDAGVFDWTNAGLQFRGGLIVERGAVARVADAFYGVQGLWGSSAVALTTGVDVTDRSKFVYSDNTKLFIKGAADPVGGGYRLAGRQVGATYDVATGLNTENVVTGWSNLGTTGKDNMHDWPRDAHVYKEFNIG